MAVMGRLDEAQQMGSERAGVVTRAESGVGNVRKGDHVVALTLHGHIALRVRIPWTSVVPTPSSMLFPKAASTVLAVATAYHSMFEAARLERGETVLIHGATGSVGQACISFAQWKGLHVLATVGTSEQHSFLGKHYEIPNDRICSCRDASFVSGVMQVTSQRGVDAVINSLSGPLLKKGWGTLVPHERLIELDIHRTMSLDMDMFRKAVSFTAVDLVQLANHRGHVMQRILIEVVALLGSKKVRHFEHAFAHSISSISMAFWSMQE